MQVSFWQPLSIFTISITQFFLKPATYKILYHYTDHFHAVDEYFSELMPIFTNSKNIIDIFFVLFPLQNNQLINCSDEFMMECHSHTTLLNTQKLFGTLLYILEKGIENSWWFKFLIASRPICMYISYKYKSCTLKIAVC